MVTTLTPGHPIRRAPVASEATSPSGSDAAGLPGAPAPVPSGRLTGRIALISGGGGGIGCAIAQLFVAEGASVVVTDIAESDAKDVADGLGTRAEHALLDVRDPAAWAAAVEAGTARFGAPPDILVTGAGVMVPGAAETTSVEDMRFAYDVNVLGVLHGIQAVVPGMRMLGRGSIVAITSMGGVSFGVPQMSPYSASKAAATALVQSAAGELGHAGIRVNAILPGQIDTPMSRAAGGSASAEFFTKMPIPRIGLPRDIAYAALYLASDESAWVTGTKFLVDGGMIAGPGL